MGGGMEADPLIRSGSLPLEGVVDYRGRPLASRSTSGGWTSALFIIGVEVAERCAYYGIANNLISYLTGPLRMSTASAAAEVNAWSGAASMLPLLGGFLADSYIGRYRTIVFASLLYVLVAFFSSSLYLMAFAQGGHRPCVQAFGADQFDENDQEECKSKSSFFNWWFFGLSVGIGVTTLLLNYVQDSIGWALGFGLPCVCMAIAFVVFLWGTRTYRYYMVKSESPLVELAQGCVTLWRSWQRPVSNSSKAYSDIEEVEARETLLPEAARQYFRSCEGYQCSAQGAHAQRSSELVDSSIRGVLRLFPIWATCLIYAVVFAQPPTLFTKQGSTMDRRIGQSFLVPPAALQSVSSVSTVTFIVVYDRVVVPLARMFTGLPTGVTMLQRIGIGMVLSIAATVVAASVETKRLQTARDFGLVDEPKAMVPMSVWWLVPQYVLYGISDVFTMVGLQEFFYDQVPDGLRSLGLAFYLSIFGIGSFISSFFVSVIDKLSRKSTGESWFSNNLNRAHLDYFYCLLAVLSTVQLVFYLYLARVFHYKKKGNVAL